MPNTEKPVFRAVKGIETVSNTFSAAFRLLVLLFISIFVVIKWSYLSQWFSTVTHVEAGAGVFKIDRLAEARQAITRYEKVQPYQRRIFNPNYAQAALAVAARTAPALIGAKVLWVDDHPENNVDLVDVLTNLGVATIRAQTTKEALERLSRDSYALVISDVGRPDESGTRDALKLCEVRYFDWPTGQQKATPGVNLQSYTDNVNRHPEPGLDLVEQVEKHYFGTPIILFTSSGRSTFANRCTSMVTSRGDILLQYVVSTLALKNWTALAGESNSWETLSEPRRETGAVTTAPRAQRSELRVPPRPTVGSGSGE